MEDEAPYREFQRRSAKIDEQIHIADLLEESRRIDEALQAYNRAFEIALEEQTPLLMPQLAAIWLGIGFCHADQRDYAGALELYHHIEAMLDGFEQFRGDPASAQQVSQSQQWYTALPEGIRVVAPQSFDPNTMLPSIYDSIALAYDNLKQRPQAQEYYQKAFEGYVKQGDHEHALRVWAYQITNSRHRQDWQALAEAGQGMYSFAKQQGNTSAQITALQALMQAAANQERILTTLGYFASVIDLERQTNHPDLARDEEMSANIWQMLEQRLRQRLNPSGESAPVLDPASLQPPSALFKAITVEYDAQGLRFVVEATDPDKATQAIRTFPLLPIPTHVTLLRQVAPDADRLVSGDGDFYIDWHMADLAGKVARTVFEPELRAELQKDAPRQFTLVLAGTREVLATYDPYDLDWYGAEGVVMLLRSNIAPIREYLQVLLDLVQRRVDQAGDATGLLTQMGFLYRLMNSHEQAEASYVNELRLGRRSDGRPGQGSMVALCNLGTLYKKRLEVERAQLAYQLALSLNPNYWDALVSLTGVLANVYQQLLCLIRAYRIRPDEEFFASMVRALCNEQPQISEPMFALIKKLSSQVDLSQPFQDLVLQDPVQAVQRLLDLK